MLLCVFIANPVAASNAQEDNITIAITGATLIDGTGAKPIDSATVIIRDGSIECVGNRQQCQLDPDIATLDATGKWLVPGFIDSHIHWQAWYDSEKKLSPQMAVRAAGIYLANGITTLVDVGGQRWVDGENRRILNELQASDQPAPRMLFSGWIDRRQIEASGSKDAGALASDLLANGAVGIKVHNGLNQQDYERIVAAADRSGYPVYGHTYFMDENGFSNLTTEAVSAGVDGIFHILGIPPVAQEDMPPLPTASMDDWQMWWLAGAKLWLHVSEDGMDKLIRLMVNNQTWLQPTLITEQSLIQPGYYKDNPNWTYSPMTREELLFGQPAFQGKDLAQYQASYIQMQTFVKRFYEAGGMVVAGTDGLPIPGFGLQEEMRLLVEAGIPSQEAIKSATLNASKAWRLQDRIGTLQQGKTADLVILAGDPLADITQTTNIWRVIKGGIVYNPENLLKQ